MTRATVRSFHTPRESDLGLRRITSGVGLAVSVLPNGGVFAIEHLHQHGRTLINQVQASPLDGGIARLYLRIRAPEPAVAEAVGPSAEVMCGRPRGRKAILWFWHAGRVRSCVRPVCAVLVTAGPDEVRGPGPNQFSALEARPDPHGVTRSRRSTVVPSPPKSPCLVAHPMMDGLMRRAGTLRPAPGAPRRCAPSCWPARRPRPCAASRAAAGRATGLSLQDCARPAAARPARR